MGLQLEKLSKRFIGSRKENVGAVRDLTLALAKGEFLVVVGPSGCGKTTTLRLIAGLETPDGGEIRLDGQPLAGVQPKDRDVAMVFQNHALLPHLTVFDNMAFGLRLRRLAAGEIDRRVREAAAMLRLERLLDRRPGALSGGECQRAALGRALVRQPRVFLFDEPLSDLDAPMRLQLRGEIAAVHRRAGAMTVYVTHDQAEAMALADRIAILRDGALQQAGTPLELYDQPANQFVAGFLGSPPMNFFEGEFALDGAALQFRGAGWSLPLGPEWRSRAGQKAVMGLRPEHIVPDPAAAMRAKLERAEFGGAETLLYLTLGSSSFIVRAAAGIPVAGGNAPTLRFEMQRVLFFDAATGAALKPPDTAASTGGDNGR